MIRLTAIRPSRGKVILFVTAVLLIGAWIFLHPSTGHVIYLGDPAAMPKASALSESIESGKAKLEPVRAFLFGPRETVTISGAIVTCAKTVPLDALKPFEIEIENGQGLRAWILPRTNFNALEKMFVGPGVKVNPMPAVTTLEEQPAQVASQELIPVVIDQTMTKVLAGFVLDIVPRLSGKAACEIAAIANETTVNGYDTSAGTPKPRVHIRSVSCWAVLKPGDLLIFGGNVPITEWLDKASKPIAANGDIYVAIRVELISER